MVSKRRPEIKAAKMTSFLKVTGCYLKGEDLGYSREAWSKVAAPPGCLLMWPQHLLYPLTWELLGIPLAELKDISVVRGIWASLHRLQLPCLSSG